MSSDEIRKRFLEFFEKRGHTVIPSASLVPENDPSALFISAGMQPLILYLMGETHPAGKRLVNVQKVLRTSDIDEVGDKTHNTFFQMLGNWSLGDYFKEDAIKWSFELLTSKEEGFGLDPNRLYITCFEGNDDAPKDDISAKFWQKVGIPESRIYFLGTEDNWWGVGDSGPSGPDTEMFYDLTPEGLGEMSKDEFIIANKEEKVTEVWNDVFMEYEKRDGKVVGPLKQKNVDTGAGLERLAIILQGKDSVYETDLFAPIIEEISKRYGNFSNDRAKRIIADHVRASVFMISDDIIPSKTDRGYILRRLLRRSIYQAWKFAKGFSNLYPLTDVIVDLYKDVYPELETNRKKIHDVFEEEEVKFMKTIARGEKKARELLSKGPISGENAFMLFATYGFPLELTKEISSTLEINVHENIKLIDKVFIEKFKKHQELSRTSSAGKFKGGLAGTGEMETKYHTATHLLLAALNEVLGGHVEQRGSNITEKRLRFDFSHGEKMTDEEKKAVENLINQKIQEDLPVSWKEMTMDEAREVGAHGIFEDKYGDKVKVYKIGDFSLEICGGPHVEHTGVLGKFKIVKESSSSAGIRRIKAILE